MVSCIEIETASLVFAYLSLLITGLGSVACFGMLTFCNVLIADLLNGADGKLSAERVAGVAYLDLIVHIGLAVFLSILAVTFAFSIILTKGLLSKKAHLVKAYFIYGVTMNTFSAILHLSLFSNFSYYLPFGFITLFGCMLYSICLIMIRRTYLKFSTTDCDQFCHKSLEEEKSIA